MWDNRIRNWYVYAHYKEDSDELFYIGIGTHRPGSTHYQKYKRAYDRSANSRNFLWLRCYKKHGRYIKILFDNLTELEAKSKEILLIELYGRVIDKSGTLCNISGGGEGRYLDNSNNKKIYVYSLSGEYIREFESCNQAADYYGLERKNVSSAANMKRITCGDYQFRYSYNKDKNIRVLTNSPRRKARAIIATNLEGTSIRFSSAYKFQKYLGIKSNAHIMDCLYGKRNTIFGWKLEFE